MLSCLPRPVPLVASVALILTPARSNAQFWGQEGREPTTYSSPSGEYELLVDPSKPSAAGPAHYRLTRKGAEAWSGDKPFTFWEAIVTDGGVAAGYAYTGGLNPGLDDGDFVVAIVAADGRLLLEEITKRQPSTFLHAAPDPVAMALFVQGDQDRLVVRVADEDVNRQNESWWLYRLSTGEKLDRIRPRDRFSGADALTWCLAAEPVAGTPLVLAQWYRCEFLPGCTQLGARFLLLDSNWKPVWELELPDDYTVPDDDAQDDLLDEIKERGAILDASTPGSFEIRFVAESVRVRFSVVANRAKEGSWRVEEVSRAAYQPPDPPAPASVTPFALETTGIVRLDAGAELAGPVRDVVAFGFDDDGRIEFVRKETAEGHFTLVELDPDGQATRETSVRLGDSGEHAWFHWDEIAGHDWLAVRAPFDDEQPTQAWRVDSRTGAAIALEAFRCADVDEVAASADGRFVVIVAHFEVRAFEADGRPRWQISNDDEDPTAVSYPSDVAALPDGAVAVVDCIGDDVRVFDASGKHVRTIDLADAWGQEPSYPSDIAPDGEGGLLITDFTGRPPLWRMTVEGDVRGRLEPRFADGSTVDELRRYPRVAPDGRVWTTDRRSFLRLGADGVVDLSVGTPRDADMLTQPGAAEIDRFGRILVQDERSGVVHVFGSDGALRFRCKPAPEDVQDASVTALLTASSDGGVLVGESRYQHTYVRYGPDGERRGEIELAGSATCAGSSGGYWASDDGLIRFDETGRRLSTTERRPDGKWGNSSSIAVGPDGSVATLDGTSDKLRVVDEVIALYAADGSPQRTIDLPPDVGGMRLGHGGRWFALSSFGPRAFLVSEDGSAVGRFEPKVPADTKSTWTTGFSPDGGELWMLQLPELLLHRFRLP